MGITVHSADPTSIIGRKFDADYALSNYDIDGLMSKYRGKIPYLGTSARDALPPNTPGALIVNLDDHSGPGTHWTALYNDGGPVAYYCDSYGLVPPIEITSRATRIIYNTGILQPSNALCGWICVYVLCELGAGVPFIDIIARFDPMPSARNINLIRKYFT